MAYEHLDIQSILEEELKKERENRLGHVQRVQYDNHLRRAAKNIDFRVPGDEETVPDVDNLGPQQVESLLAFRVEAPTERALENAERDNIVYDGLGEHRILGKKKKKRPSKSCGDRTDK